MLGQARLRFGAASKQLVQATYWAFSHMFNRIINIKNDLQKLTSAGETSEDEPEQKERSAGPTADKGAQK